mgnify:CR=1 FL=1
MFTPGVNRYVKILHASLIHNKFTYKEGLNVDVLPFDGSGSCKPGGLYFTDLENFLRYTNFGTLVADVTIPDDAKVYPEPCRTKWKANKIILSRIRPIEDIFDNCEDSVILQLIQYEPVVIRYVRNQTEELCRVAIEKNPYALSYIRNQTEEMCLLAMKKDSMMLEWIKNQTEELCLSAVRRNPDAISVIKNQTKTLCRIAVEKKPSTLGYINDQTEELCALAVKFDKAAIFWVYNESILINMLKKDGLLLAYRDNPTKKMIDTAVKQNPYALQLYNNRNKTSPIYWT